MPMMSQTDADLNTAEYSPCLPSHQCGDLVRQRDTIVKCERGLAGALHQDVDSLQIRRIEFPGN